MIGARFPVESIIYSKGKSIYVEKSAFMMPLKRKGLPFGGGGGYLGGFGCCGFSLGIIIFGFGALE